MLLFLSVQPGEAIIDEKVLRDMHNWPVHDVIDIVRSLQQTLIWTKEENHRQQHEILKILHDLKKHCKSIKIEV